MTYKELYGAKEKPFIAGGPLLGAAGAAAIKEEVAHPSHYAGKYECIDVMEEIYGKQAVIDFCLCNAFKYLWRSKQKHETPLTDLKKARFYIDWIINKEDQK